MGKCLLFQPNLGMCFPQINHLRKMSTVLRVSIHIYRVSEEIDGKMKTFIFRVNLGM